MNDFIEIKPSPKHGKGLFALKDFSAGEAVFVLKPGRVVNHEEIGRLSRFEKMHLDQIGNNQYEIIEPPGCYANHSCAPNLVERDRTGYALADIKAGEEITIDYDQIAYLEEPFTCHCGHPNCRGLIHGKTNI